MRGLAACSIAMLHPVESDTYDPELWLDCTPTDLHSMRAVDRELDDLSNHIQKTAASAAVASLQRDDPARAASLNGQRILVTGSAGYVGAALCHALQGLGADALGLDVVAGRTVSVEADVADVDAVRAAVEGCDGVLNVAAMHAPHAMHHHLSEFIATNITGTQNILDTAAEAGGIPVVHVSTTSMTISRNVKQAESSGQMVWLDETAQPPQPATAADDPDDAPRNKYGRTKLEAELRCVVAARSGLPCAIVRISRCFPEEVLPTDSTTQAAAALSAPNLKANELLGRRLALVDVVTGLLRALARAREPAIMGRVLTLSAPFPFARSDTPTASGAFLAFLKEQRPGLSGVYAKESWSLPTDLGRVYDSTLAVQLLDWKPLVTFDTLIAALEGTDTDAISVDDARAGRY